MKAPSPPGTLLVRRNRKLTSIEPTWKPGHEFIPSSARGPSSARPSAVPSLPSVATPTLKEQLREKWISISFRRPARNVKGKGGSSNQLDREKESLDETVRPARSRTVLTAAEAVGRRNPPAVQDYISRVALAENINPRSKHHLSAYSSRQRTIRESQRFSPTIRGPRPVSAYSPLDPVVSLSDRHVPTPSVLQPRASTRSSMPPLSSRRIVPGSSVPPPTPMSRVSIPPQTANSRVSMPPLTANGGWALGSPPSAQDAPPSAVIGYLPHERRWVQQQPQHAPELQHPQPSPYPPVQHSPYPPAQASPDPEARHSPYPPTAQDHQLPPNQYPQYPRPSQPYFTQQGRVMVPQHDPLAGRMGPKPMSPNSIPFSPYPEQGPYLPPMPPMSPMGPCFENPQGFQPPQVQRSLESGLPQQNQQPHPSPAHPWPSWADRFHWTR